jgi:hypothetical protein
MGEAEGCGRKVTAGTGRMRHIEKVLSVVLDRLDRLTAGR